MESLYTSSRGMAKALRWFSRGLWLAMAAAVIASVSYAMGLRDELEQSHARVTTLRRELRALASERDAAQDELVSARKAQQMAKNTLLEATARVPVLALPEVDLPDPQTAGGWAAAAETQSRLELIEHENAILRGQITALEQTVQRVTSGGREVAVKSSSQDALDRAWQAFCAEADNQGKRKQVADALIAVEESERLAWLQLRRSEGARDLLLEVIDLGPPRGGDRLIKDIFESTPFAERDSARFVRALRSYGTVDANEVRLRIAEDGRVASALRVEAAKGMALFGDERANSMIRELYILHRAGDGARLDLLALPRVTRNAALLDVCLAAVLDEAATDTEVEEARQSLGHFGTQGLKRLRQLAEHADALRLTPQLQKRVETMIAALGTGKHENSARAER